LRNRLRRSRAEEARRRGQGVQRKARGVENSRGDRVVGRLKQPVDGHGPAAGFKTLEPKWWKLERKGSLDRRQTSLNGKRVRAGDELVRLVVGEKPWREIPDVVAGRNKPARCVEA